MAVLLFDFDGDIIAQMIVKCKVGLDVCACGDGFVIRLTACGTYV